MEKNTPEEWLADLPLQTEDIRFKPEQMIACAKCGRGNPPNRLNCLYCAGELALTDQQRQSLNLKLRRLEDWEKGFNIILLPHFDNFTAVKTAEIARLLKMENAVLEKLLVSKTALPLARAALEEEAEIVQTRLGEIGVQTRVVSDAALATEQPPKRLRGIEFSGDRLILMFFNRDKTIEISSADLALIVTGAVFERRIEATEKYTKKGDNKILNQTETATDEMLFDVYSRGDSFGFRVYAKGFDFSSLEADKQLLARNNIKKLVEKLRRFAPDAKFVDDYLANRSLLMNVWEVEQKTDSQGLKRESFGKFNLGNVTTVNNTAQFTKYSRLQWHLL